MTVRKCINCKWLHVLNGNCIHPSTNKIGPRPNDDSCGRFEPAGQEETEGCAGGVDDEELYQWARSLLDESAGLKFIGSREEENGLIFEFERSPRCRGFIISFSI